MSTRARPARPAPPAAAAGAREDGVLALGALRLPLATVGRATLLAPAPEVPGPLLAIVNAALTGHFRGLRAALAAGLPASVPGLAAWAPDPEVDTAALAARWTALTGLPAGEDLVLLGVSYLREPAAVPRAALLGLLDELEARRAPPRPAVRDRWAGLESRARRAEPAPGRAAPPVRLRLLLAQLEAAGILDPAQGPAWERVLTPARHPVLLGYVRAVQALVSYYASAARHAALGAPELPPVLGGPVSLEWFRAGPAADPGVAGALPAVEHALRTGALDPAGAADTLACLDGRWLRLRWRYERAGQPALVAAAPA